jgi:tetratricopeptide (TPR) repeat protein
MKGMVNHAMLAWQSATNNKVRFVETASPNKADIIVRWKRNFSHNKVGENPFESWGNTIVRSDVTIATYAGENGPPMPMPELQKTILHELGHAIGIQGHSPYPEDIMYYTINPAQSTTLSIKDKTTITMLYKMEPDIKNSATLSTAQTRKYYTIMEQAVKNQLSQKPSQAISYYKQALQMNPQDPDLYYNLGGALWDAGDNTNAMLSYRKALSLDHSRMDAKYNLGALLVNEGVKAINKNNKNLARQEFQEAVTLFEEVSRSPNPPAQVKKNLDIARKNLTLASQ